MIPKRLFWFGAGVATGFGGALYAYGRVREARGRLAADRLAGTLSDQVLVAARQVGRAASAVRATVEDALDEGRDAMLDTQQQLERQLAPRSSRSGERRWAHAPRAADQNGEFGATSPFGIGSRGGSAATGH